MSRDMGRLRELLWKSYYVLFEQAMMVVKRRLDRHYKQIGLRPREAWLLMGCRYGEFSQKCLANEIGLRESELSMMVSSMIRRGLLKQERNPQDRREWLLRPTRQGKKLLKWIDEQFPPAVISTWHPLSIAELDYMRNSSLRIIRAEKERRENEDRSPK